MHKYFTHSAQRQLDIQRAARTDPQVRMFEDLIPVTTDKSIYLTPTFSDTKGVHKHFWHLEVREMLRDLGYQGLIFIPQNRGPCGRYKQTQHLHWCNEALTQASHLIFSISKNQTEQEVRQIIYQLGFAIGRKSTGSTQTILVSAPNKQIPCPLTKFNLKAAGIPTFFTLHRLLCHIQDM